MEVKRENAIAGEVDLDRSGFNPCFDGSEARGGGRARVLAINFQFQSLF